jgi:WD40 repeat protein
VLGSIKEIEMECTFTSVVYKLKKPMSKLLTILILILTCFNSFGQDYKKVKSRYKHSEKIIAIATNNDFFATCSYDKSVIVWDYEGKVICKYKLTDGKINSMSFLQDSDSLLIGVTEKDETEKKRYIIKCIDFSGKMKYEIIDTTLTQELVNNYYNNNTTGVQSVIRNVSSTFPDLNIQRDLDVPRVIDGLSHFEIVQDIDVSPNKQSISSIDKFNILKIWDSNGKLNKSLQITNNKKDTEIYYLSDSIIFVTPNIILNTKSLDVGIIDGFEYYTSIPFAQMIYFYFDYNNESKPEKLYNFATTEIIEFDIKDFYTLYASQSLDKLALLGVDGLIRVINNKGELLAKFGKDRNELITFRGEKIQLFSNIYRIGFSPNGRFIISGDKDGKISIWKSE